MASPLEARLAARLAAASASILPESLSRLARYVELLAHWNRRINLTSLEIDPPTDAALDRLIVEPVLAAAWIRPSDRRAIDVGSGGGSPAIPIAVACPGLHVTMVESRGKKCAFLREAVRELGVSNADVHQGRFGEALGSPSGADVVTVRAVALDVEFWRITNRTTVKASRVLSFSASGEAMPDGWAVVENGPAALRVLERF